MLGPGQALDLGIEHQLRACRVSDVGWRQIHREKSSVGIGRGMPLTPADVFVCVIAALTGSRCHDALAVGDAGRGDDFTMLARPVEHQCQVVDRSEEEASYQATGPVVDSLVGWKIVRQHAHSHPERTR